MFGGTIGCRLHNQSGKEHCRKKHKTRNIAVLIFKRKNFIGMIMIIVLVFVNDNLEGNIGYPTVPPRLTHPPWLPAGWN